jgi:hypothetical protein
MGGEAQDRMSFIENPRNGLRSQGGSEEQYPPNDDSLSLRTTDAVINHPLNQLSFLESAIAHIRLGAPGWDSFSTTRSLIKPKGSS